MTRPKGDRTSYFQDQRTNPSGVELLSTQVDPSTPSSSGYTLVTDPLLPDKHLSARLDNFDPEIYDLSENSNLTKLLNALLGAAGVGGARRQMTIQRLASSLNSAHFLDLDSFYGPLFGLHRLPNEVIDVDPATETASPSQWDTYAARDAAYRTRIIQFAKALNLGSTRKGIEMVATAVLQQPVRVFETWMYKDVIAQAENTWSFVEKTYSRWGNFDATPWYEVSGKSPLQGASPAGNFSETVIFATEDMTEDERHELMIILDVIKPSGVIVSVLPGKRSNQDVLEDPRDYTASSEYWDVVTVTVPNQSLHDPASGAIYPENTESSRPAFSEYDGEKISYISLVNNTTSYQSDDGNIFDTRNSQTVVYPDGVQINYTPENALPSTSSVIASRMSSSGILTSYPYAIQPRS